MQTIILFATKWFGWALDSINIWMICPALLLFYIIFNVVLGVEQKNIGHYYRDSIYGVIGFLTVDVFYAKWLSGQSVFEVKSIAWIIIVFCIVYLVFISILNLIRFIMHLVLKQDKNIQDADKDNP
ncbi:MAG: hypothetical protein IT267_05820 [Saprospiraceae bacterium]|nr:hypothetical protein [Saprospiraceae bacterium]